MLKTNYMRNLNSEDIAQSITISGVLIRISHLLPEMQKSFLQCQVCTHTALLEMDHGWIAKPCVWVLTHNHSVFSDEQMIKLQESSENMPARQMLHAVILFTHNDLVDKVQPGDRVNSTDIYRAVLTESIQEWVMWSLSTKPTLKAFIIRKWVQNICMKKQLKIQNGDFFQRSMWYCLRSFTENKAFMRGLLQSQLQACKNMKI